MEKYYKNNAYDAYDGYDTFSKGVTGLNAQLLLEQRVLVCITERALGGLAPLLAFGRGHICQ